METFSICSQIAGRSNCEDHRDRNISEVHGCKQREQKAVFLMKRPQKMTKKRRYLEKCSDDSAKSEEEAATMIQAMYRGYKARRQFDEVSKYGKCSIFYFISWC